MEADIGRWIFDGYATILDGFCKLLRHPVRRIAAIYAWRSNCRQDSENNRGFPHVPPAQRRSGNMLTHSRAAPEKVSQFVIAATSASSGAQCASFPLAGFDARRRCKFLRPIARAAASMLSHRLAIVRHPYAAWLGTCCRWSETKSIREAQGIETLRRHMRDLIDYLESNTRALMNYGARQRHGEPVSTAFVESEVNEIVSCRIIKRQQMRWNRWTVQPFLDVRAAVLNGTLEGAFRRRHPDIGPVNCDIKSLAAA